jgi:hypothetical protein
VFFFQVCRSRYTANSEQWTGWVYDVTVCWLYCLTGSYLSEVCLLNLIMSLAYKTGTFHFINLEYDIRTSRSTLRENCLQACSCVSQNRSYIHVLFIQNLRVSSPALLALSCRSLYSFRALWRSGNHSKHWHRFTRTHPPTPFPQPNFANFKSHNFRHSVLIFLKHVPNFFLAGMKA